MIEKILKQYKIVFNEDGSVKNCGRDNCIKLIELLTQMFPTVSFGNQNTGFMNIDIIHQTMKVFDGDINERIKEQYNVVFDENGNTKLCGRDNCIKLMELLSKEFPTIPFGNIETGFMNIENIKTVINMAY